MASIAHQPSEFAPPTAPQRPSRAWWRLLPSQAPEQGGDERLHDIAALLTEVGVPTELSVWLELGPGRHRPLISVRSLQRPDDPEQDAIVDQFRSAAGLLGLPMEHADAAPCVRPRLLSLAAHDEAPLADLRMPPMQHLRALLPLSSAETPPDLGLSVVVRAHPVGPATLQDVAALRRDVRSRWRALKVTAPFRPNGLRPLLRRSHALLDDCAGLTVSVTLHGSEAPGWSVQRCLERRLGADLELDAGWVTGAPRWVRARADTLRILLALGIAW